MGLWLKQDSHILDDGVVFEMGWRGNHARFLSKYRKLSCPCHNPSPPHPRSWGERAEPSLGELWLLWLALAVASLHVPSTYVLALLWGSSVGSLVAGEESTLLALAFLQDLLGTAPARPAILQDVHLTSSQRGRRELSWPCGLLTAPWFSPTLSRRRGGEEEVAGSSSSLWASS